MLRFASALARLGAALLCAALFATAARAEPPGAVPAAAPDTAAAGAPARPAAGAPAPPASLRAIDTPHDRGRSLDLTWSPSPSEASGGVARYIILRAAERPDSLRPVSAVATGVHEYTDTSVENGVDYFYRVRAEGPGGVSESEPAGPVRARQQWFNPRRWNLLVISLVLIAAIAWFILQASAGKELTIRKIAGVSAIDEAVGRATEMGKPVLFIPGMEDMDSVQTVAGLTILSNVAQLVARYETKLQVPTRRSLVMSVARETIKESYLKVGRPDLYRDDMVYYISDEQFAFVAAVDGVMTREKPAACFYMGAFFAESLILAETGNGVGAIQVAGTAQPTQLPFFVAACDYTLIGEELFAASAYLSHDRRMLGSLKGQDVGKAIAAGFVLLGVLLATIASATGNATAVSAAAWVHDLFRINP